MKNQTSKVSKPKFKVIPFLLNSEDYYEKAVAYFEDGNFWFALKNCRQAVRLEPECIEYSLLLSDILSEMQLHESAVNAGLKLLSYDEEITECYFQIASNLIAMDEPQNAVEFLNAGVRKNKDFTVGFMPEKEDLSELMQRVKAVDKYTLVDHETEYRAMIMWANVLRVKKEYESALQVLEFVPEASAHFGRAKALRAECCLAAGRTDAAEKLSREVLSAVPDDTGARVNLLKIALSRGDHAAVNEQLEYLEASGVSDVQGYVRYVATLFDEGMHERGLCAARRFLEREPYSREMLLLEGLAYYNTGRTFEAKQNMLSILNLDDMDITARYYNLYFQSHERMKKPLEYRLDVPEEGRQKQLRALRKAVKLHDDDFEEWIGYSDNACLVYWALQNVSEDVECDTIMFELLEKASMRVEDLLRENLMSTNTSSLSKRSLLTGLLHCAPATPVALIVGYELKLLDSRLPKGVMSADPRIRNAYIDTFVSLSLVTSGFEKSLQKTYASSKEKLRGVTLTDADQFALAAAFACMVGKGALIKNKKAVSEIFGADIKRTDFFLKLLTAKKGTGKK